MLLGAICITQMVPALGISGFPLLEVYQLDIWSSIARTAFGTSRVYWAPEEMANALNPPSNSDNATYRPNS